MIRLASLGLVALLSVGLIGAAGGQDKGDKGDKAPDKGDKADKGDKGEKGDAFDSPFYPLKVGTTWEYSGGGKKVVITVKSHEEVPGNGKCAVLETDSGGGKLTEHLAVKSDGIYRVLANGKTITPPVLVLRNPVKAGEEWQVNSKVDNFEITGKWSISAEEKLKIGTDEYSAYPVKSTDLKMGPQAASVERWYSKDRGMVKYHFRIPSASIEISLELEKFTAGK